MGLSRVSPGRTTSQTPRTQVWPVAQRRSQPPQLSSSMLVSTHEAPQREPDVQFERMKLTV
jgi:hypothetical protein